MLGQANEASSRQLDGVLTSAMEAPSLPLSDSCLPTVDLDSVACFTSDSAIFIYLACLCVCVWVPRFTCVEVRGQIVEVASLLPHGSLRSNSGCQAW